MHTTSCVLRAPDDLIHAHQPASSLLSTRRQFGRINAKTIAFTHSLLTCLVLLLTNPVQLISSFSTSTNWLFYLVWRFSLPTLNRVLYSWFTESIWYSLMHWRFHSELKKFKLHVFAYNYDNMVLIEFQMQYKSIKLKQSDFSPFTFCE